MRDSKELNAENPLGYMLWSSLFLRFVTNEDEVCCFLTMLWETNASTRLRGNQSSNGDFAAFVSDKQVLYFQGFLGMYACFGQSEVIHAIIVNVKDIKSTKAQIICI